jgi:chromate transporter
MAQISAMNSLQTSLALTELMGLFGHFLLLSLLSIGGAITTAPDMHRYLVSEQHWLTDDQFTASIALAQAAPGPNVLFVAVVGWNVAGPAGALATMMGILLPSTTLALWATRWGAQRRETRGVQAFTSGMAPITLGLLLATGSVLAEPSLGLGDRLPLDLKALWQALPAAGLIMVTVAVMLRTRLSPMWLIAIGAAAGSLGWV